ncbi:MAG: hypothetical protein EXQ89_02260 [Rhodospirillaceae bacterium]|nr:hypothetical protein [Rhodospirillaceae bacterium]
MRKVTKALICAFAGAGAIVFSADAAAPVKPAKNELMWAVQSAPRAPAKAAPAAPAATQKPPAAKKAATPQAKPAPQTAAKPQTPTRRFGRPGRTANDQ